MLSSKQKRNRNNQTKLNKLNKQKKITLFHQQCFHNKTIQVNWAVTWDSPVLRSPPFSFWLFLAKINYSCQGHSGYGYGLRARRTGFNCWWRQETSALFHSLQTGCRANPARSMMLTIHHPVPRSIKVMINIHSLHTYSLCDLSLRVNCHGTSLASHTFCIAGTVHGQFCVMGWASRMLTHATEKHVLTISQDTYSSCIAIRYPRQHHN
jgi:hypothetical protein